MQYDYTIKAEIAHIKLISKALDILKSIAKGEISRVSSLLPENKKTHIEIIKEFAAKLRMVCKISKVR